eukprot:c45059_g1_i1 orf=93-242(-)
MVMSEHKFSVNIITPDRLQCCEHNGTSHLNGGIGTQISDWHQNQMTSMT